MFSECFCQILRQSVKSTYPINSFKVDIFCQNEVRVLAWERFQTTHASSADFNTSSHCETMNHRTPWRQLQWKRISWQKNRITVALSYFNLMLLYRLSEVGK